MDDISQELVALLQHRQPQTARQLARALAGVTRSRVNSALYGHVQLFRPDASVPPRWSLAVAADVAEELRTEDDAFARLAAALGGANPPAPVPDARGSASRSYAPLRDFLSGTQAPEVKASFAELESTLGCALPPSARRHRAWWANAQGGSRPQAAAWLEAGWRVHRVNLTAEDVTFIRIDACSY